MKAGKFAKPSPCRLGQKSIYEIAESVAQQLGFKPGGDIDAVLKKLGGKRKYLPIWEIEGSDSGSMQVDGESDFTIFLPEHTSPTRDRFTIAHELGHYVLHYLWPKQKGAQLGPIMVTRYGSDQLEWEANWFAAAFLMPAKAFKTVYEKHYPDFTEIADYFGVSMQAAQVRAKALGLRS